MAYSFNGIGTEYWGKRDIAPDGSYTVTKFFCLLFPVIPLGSYRVREIGEKQIYLGGTNQRYEIIEKVNLNWIQIVKVYSLYPIALGVLYLAAKWWR